MRNVLAKQYLDILDKTHEDLIRNICAGKMDAAAGLLEKCQNDAIQFGTMIEKRIGEGTATVGFLEQYCELAYHVHESIRQVTESEKKDIYGQLDVQLKKISDSVEKELDMRSEAIFLPFKLGTWDALESVWQAAENDPDCDAYVIPIPYYNKNPDGSLGEMHYEAKGFPVHARILHYEEYDFAGRRPDMIFFQNAYDECNYTFSVHPFFYSGNLKQFTDKLVYIPWFVLDEITEEDERGGQSMEYFVTVPGVINANKVIVQSEQMRQSYIQALVKAEGEDTRHIWEGKILGLGSPLFDRRGTVQDKFDGLPDSWKSKLIKTDGSKKKLVLYGTSIGELLHHKEAVIDKIQSVIDIFRKNQEEVVLLWKPDIAITKEFEAVAGGRIMERYHALVRQFQAEAWGIYDESEDLGRVVAAADAYYGDSCRAVQMCRQAGIPVMLQDISIR